MRVIPKVLGHGESGMADAKPGPGRFIHLAEDHYGFVEHPGIFHLAIQFFTFPAALADAAEYTDTLVPAHGVVDQFSNEHGLAHTGTAEQDRPYRPVPGGPGHRWP